MLRNSLLSILILFSFISYSQIISGSIFDKKTNETLPGASVYLDGTTLGTNSDMDGNFELDVNSSQNASVIISFIGYETQVFSISDLTNSENIFLEESSNQLNEVKLGLDIWSRQKKMQIFKFEFLGRTEASSKCSIVNEKDIILIYNSAEQTLTAYADVPIIIKNKYLGYELAYNVVDFEIEFMPSIIPGLGGPGGIGFPMTKQVYYAGTSFFKELNTKTKEKILLNRENEFQGSLVHFMRSLSTKQLSENKFQIYFDKLPVPPYKYLSVSNENDLAKIHLTANKLAILYNNYDQSGIQPVSEDSAYFLIDEYGIHTPPNNILFSGDFGDKRIANMLPLNFVPNSN